jgi:MFS transporter, DHA1 family, multidrug resistance protein
MPAKAIDTKEKVTFRSIVADPLVGPLIGIVFLYLVGFGLVFPVLPLFARSFGVGNDGAGLLIGAFGVARLVGDLIGGSIIDRKGERWTAVTGMASLALCSAATGAAPNFVLAVVFWALAGVGSAVVFASLYSYLLKAAPADRVGRTLSFFYGAFNAGVIAGGAVGGFLAERFGLDAPLYAYAFILVVGIAAYIRFVPSLPAGSSVEHKNLESEAEGRGSEGRPPSSSARDLLKVPGFITTLFVNLTYLWIVAAIFNTLIPLFANQELAMSPGAIGAMFAVGVAVEFIVLFPAGSLADRLGRRMVLLPSLIGLAIVTAVLGTASSGPVLTLFFAVLAIFSGFAGVPPAAMLADIVPAAQSGRAVGIFRFSGDIGFALAPLIVGTVSKSFGFNAAFVVTAVVPAAAALVTLRTRETLRR